MISKPSRYIINTYKYKEISEDAIISNVKTKLEETLEDQLNYYPPITKHKIYSNGKKKVDFSMYTGTGGNMYLYWRYYLLCKQKYPELKSVSLEYLQSAYKINHKIVEHDEEKDDFDIYLQSTSFFHGQIGVYAMGCLYAKEIGDETLFTDNLNNVLKYKTSALSDESEDELLYGNAGYLYALLLIYKECRDLFKFNIDKDIYDIAMFLYEIGSEKQKKYKTDFLIYPFPRNSKKRSKESHFYLGGAHGLIGVLYMLLSSIYYLPELFDSENNNLKEDLKISLVNLSKLQFKSGNFPSSLEKEKDELVHFCHGATGSVFLYTLAYILFKDDTMLQIAIKAGNTIWERGILKKGNGVCHGISGNTYSLYNLYITTKDTTWKNKMYCLLSATTDKDINKQLMEYDDPQRMCKGIPDTPYSLMEGQSGLICLYCDILNGDDYVQFPGFQLV